MAYITQKSKKPEMLGDLGFKEKKPEYIKKKKKIEYIKKKEKKTEKKEWITKKEYPKIGKDY